MNQLPERITKQIEPLVKAKIAQLPTDHVEALNKLTPGSEAHRIVSAKFMGVKILEIPYEQCIDYVVDIVDDAIKTMGHYKVSETASTLQHISEGIIKTIGIRFKNMTLQELVLVMAYGVRGKYKKKTELDTVNIVNFERWACAFKVDDTVRTALDAYHNILKLPAAVVELSAEERKKIIIDGTQSAYDYYLETGRIHEHCKPYYKYLEQKHSIVLPDEEFKEVGTLARQRAIENVSEPTNAQKKQVIKEINLGKHTSFRKECYKIALEKFFSKCKEAKVKNIHSLSTEA